MKKQKHKIITHYNAGEYPSQGEINTDPSMTVAGESMPIKDMLIRYSNGIPIKTDPRLRWADEEYDQPLPSINDLTDIDNVKEFMDNIKKNVSKAMKRKLEIQKDLEKTDPPIPPE